MQHKTFLVLCSLFYVSWCVGTAQAQPPQTISYPNFASTDGLNLNGVATTTTTSDGIVLRLTPAVGGEAGTAFSKTRIQLGASNTFSTFFQFRISNPSVPPADGLVFVVQPVSSSLGGGGGGMGYAGISPSVGIEFDTFNNGEINNNHVAVDTDGNLQDFAAVAPYGVNECDFPQGVRGCMANGDLWSVWIDYDGTNLHVALADGSTQRPADSIVYPINISSLLDTSAAYVGFTAGTGALWESHDIVNWQFTGTYQPIQGPSGLTITPASLPTGFVGRNYSALMSVSGGTGPYTWRATNLPPGLAMGPAGVISGTPTQSGTFSGTIAVTDSASGSGSISYTIAINTSTVPIYLTGNGYMGTVAIGQTPAPVTFTASGGKPPYSWSISGAPGGLSLNANGATATVSGTPTAAGVYSFSVQVSDTQGISTGGSGFLSVLGVISAGLPDATAFASYTGTVSATGGTAPYSFVVTGLPSGLSVTSDGQFRGQPATAGSFNLGIKVTDSSGLTAITSLSLNVKPAPVLTLTGGALPAGLVNAGYSQTLTATGGGQPYNYAFASGSLPAGLRLSATGTLSGVPTTSGSFSFLARVTDTTGASATGNFTLLIATPPVVLTTASPLASGMVAVDYPPTAMTAKGGIPPYTFSVSTGALPDGLNMSSLGNLGGTPKTAGSYSFDVTVTDSTGQTGKATLALLIRPAATDLILSAGTISFAIPAGTTKIPADQVVQVQSSDVSKTLGWSASSGTPWMQASATGTTPGQFSVSLTPAALLLLPADQPYQASVTVTCADGPCAGRTQLVNVQLSVNAVPAQLTLGASLLTFSTSAAAPAGATQTLNVANTGGLPLGIGSLKCGAPWCSVSGIPGQVAPGSSSDISINVNPAGLGIGYYWTSVSLVTSAGSATVPVTLFITGNPGIILAPTGSQLNMQAGGVISAPPQSFLITAGSATPVSWTASIVQGSFLILANTSGTASSSQPGTVNFSIDPTAAAALAPGAYYGLIGVTAAGVANSPQDFVVVLNVTASTQQTQPDPTPAGLLFVTQTNSSPAQQSVTLYNSAGQAQGWQASVQTSDGSSWLSVSPAIGSTLAAAPAVTSVAVDSSKLTPGIYHGSVNYAFAAIGVRSVNVTVVVQSPLAAAATSELQTRAQCAPTKIAATSTELVSNFSSPTAWPTELEIAVVDDCGAPSNSAQMVATFSNGDPPMALTLADPANGRYSATWTPRKVSSQVVINAEVRVTGFAPATVQLKGAVVPSGAPTVNPGAVLNLFNPVGGAPAAPGTLLQIGGTYLAAQPATSTTNPLPKTLGGTSVLIGGVVAPISSVAAGQINVEAPFELTPGQPYQVVVSANGALTTPEALQFTPTAPGLSVASAGYVTAIHQADGKSVTEVSPAKPGEAISVFLTGLGLTDVKVDSGAGGPSNPPANVLSVPAVTVDSVAVTITFAGLAPGQPGVYRIDFTVPATAASGDLAVQVTQDGVTTNTGLLPVHK